MPSKERYHCHNYYMHIHLPARPLQEGKQHEYEVRAGSRPANFIASECMSAMTAHAHTTSRKFNALILSTNATDATGRVWVCQSATMTSLIDFSTAKLLSLQTYQFLWSQTY